MTKPTDAMRAECERALDAWTQGSDLPLPGPGPGRTARYHTQMSIAPGKCQRCGAFRAGFNVLAPEVRALREALEAVALRGERGCVFIYAGGTTCRRATRPDLWFCDFHTNPTAERTHTEINGTPLPTPSGSIPEASQRSTTVHEVKSEAVAQREPEADDYASAEAEWSKLPHVCGTLSPTTGEALRFGVRWGWGRGAK